METNIIEESTLNRIDGASFYENFQDKNSNKQQIWKTVSLF